MSALKQPNHIHVFTKKGMKENANAKLPFWITVLNCFEQLCWNFTKASFHFDTFCQNTLHYYSITCKWIVRDFNSSKFRNVDFIKRWTFIPYVIALLFFFKSKLQYFHLRCFSSIWQYKYADTCTLEDHLLFKITLSMHQLIFFVKAKFPPKMIQVCTNMKVKMYRKTFVQYKSENSYPRNSHF